MTQTVLLGDIADVLNGAAISSRDFITKEQAEEGDLPVFKMGNLAVGGGLRQGKDDYIPLAKLGKLQKQITQPYDILMCMTDMKSSMNLLGHSGQIKDEIFAVNQRVGIIRPMQDKINPVFLYYYLNSPDFIQKIRATANSGVQVNLSTSAIRDTEIHLPDKDQQEFIANSIGTLDEKIELNRKMNETLEQMGQALFRHYFIDNPEAEKWEYVPISELCDKVSSGGTPATKREDYYGGDVQWYSTKELKDGFLFGSEKTITNEGLSNSAAKLFPENTVMIAIYAAPTVGRLGILTSQASFNQATCGLIAKPEIGYEFVYLYLLLSRAELNNMANGAAQQNISVGKVRDFRVMRPDSVALSGFREHISPIFAQIRNNSEEIKALTTLREALLPRLISGRVKV